MDDPRAGLGEGGGNAGESPEGGEAARRASRLHRLEPPVEASVAGERTEATVRVVALGPREVLVLGGAALPPGGPLTLRLPLPGEAPISAEVTLGGERPDGAVLLGITHLEADAANAYDAFLTRNRKGDHIRLVRDAACHFHETRNGFERWRLPHEALPEIDLDEVRTECRLLGKDLRAPLLISCMTGGSLVAGRINRNLALAAERTGVGMGLGSQRIILQDAKALPTFQVRDAAPGLRLLIGNIGAVQLNYGVGEAEIVRLIEAVRADAMAFHLNPLQEAVQPEGDTRFGGLVAKLCSIVPRLPVPAVLKEIGCGISYRTALACRSIGFRAVDVAGAGGTSWARVEAARASDPRRKDLGEAFGEWGIPTAESVVAVRRALPGVEVIASGGVRNGIEIAKAIALGADAAAIARPFLVAADRGVDDACSAIEHCIEELRIAMFCAGARTIDDLKRVTLQPA